MLDVIMLICITLSGQGSTLYLHSVSSGNGSITSKYSEMVFHFFFLSVVAILGCPRRPLLCSS